MYVRNHDVPVRSRPPGRAGETLFRLADGRKEECGGGEFPAVSGLPAARIHRQRRREGQEPTGRLHDHARASARSLSHAWSEPMAAGSAVAPSGDVGLFRRDGKARLAADARLRLGTRAAAGLLRRLPPRPDEHAQAQPLPAAGDHGRNRDHRSWRSLRRWQLHHPLAGTRWGAWRFATRAAIGSACRRWRARSSSISQICCSVGRMADFRRPSTESSIDMARIVTRSRSSFIPRIPPSSDRWSISRAAGSIPSSAARTC